MNTAYELAGGAEPRLVASYGSCNMSAAKVVGTGLVIMLAEVLKDYEVALVSVDGGIQTLSNCSTAQSSDIVEGLCTRQVYIEGIFGSV